MIEIGKFNIIMDKRIHEFSVVDDGTIAERIYESKVKFIKAKFNYMFNGIFTKSVPDQKIGTDIISKNTLAIFKEYNSFLASQGQPIIDYQKVLNRKFSGINSTLKRKKRAVKDTKEFTNYIN